MKIIIMLSVVVLSHYVIADEPAEQCKYNKASITEINAEQTNVVSSEWAYSRDPDSDEHVKTNYLRLNNGDLVVIEHKYCSMYNFEFNYFVARSNRTINPSMISNVVKQLVKSNAKIFPESADKMAQAVKSSLLSQKFNKDKRYSQGIEPVISRTRNVEMSYTYTPYENIGTIFAAVINFYLGVDGPM